MECKDADYRACKAAALLDGRIAKLSMLTLACFAFGCVIRGGGQPTSSSIGPGSNGGGAGAASATGAAGPGGATSGGSPGLPVPPGAGLPRPSGTPGNITVLNWAGFTSAVSYTFDDTNSSQISNYAALNALGVRMTFYLITNKTTEFNARSGCRRCATATRSAATRAATGGRAPPPTSTRATWTSGTSSASPSTRWRRLSGTRATSPSRRPLSHQPRRQRRQHPPQREHRPVQRQLLRPGRTAPPRAPSTTRSTQGGRPARGRPCWSMASWAAATARTSRSRSASSPRA